ncbi:MAG TPA: phosphoglycerate kinase [Polyangia bacterium]
MTKLTIHDVEVRGKRVLVRTDLNLPLQRGRVLDDALVRAALPTITELTSRGARVVLMSHLGRPQGRARADYRMDPVAARLGKFLGRPVRKIDQVIGPEAERAVGGLADGEVLLLENLRFHHGEAQNDPELARALARLGDLYVNDCFATAHHAEASNAGVARLLPSCAGLLLAEEVRRLDANLGVPRHPFVVVLGGARIDEKLPAIAGMLGRADAVLLGSGTALPFFAARGLTAGGRQVATDEIEAARGILGHAEEVRTEIVLPRDLVVTDNPIVQNEVHTVPAVAIPPDLLVVDIGPETTALYAERIRAALLVVWNAPVGINEVEDFAAGTLAIAQAVADTEATTLVGGGDTTTLVRQAGLAERVVHLSTGGEAFLQYVAGHELPGLTALPERG